MSSIFPKFHFYFRAACKLQLKDYTGTIEDCDEVKYTVHSQTIQLR